MLIFLFLLICSNLFSSTPYQELKELRPFCDHGWYENDAQLARLIRERKVRVVVEVGSWMGKSTIAIAQKLPRDGKVYAVDHWKGSTEHQPGHSAYHPYLDALYEQFLSNVIHKNLTEKIVPIRMDSLAAAHSLQVVADLVYIDASHETEAVYQDLVAWFPFVQGHGVICGDDWGWASVRAAVKRFAQERKLKITPERNFWKLSE